MNKFAVLISAGGSKFGAKAGWDMLFSTRAEAVACAKRARANDGWRAKTVRMSAEQARGFGWS